MKILVAEDDHDDFDLFLEAVLIIDPTVQCIRAHDGKQTLSILENILPDLIFLDINMPRMNGKECLRKIKMSSTFQDIPVVVHSTTINPNEINFYEALGAKVLTKDHRIDKIVESLKTILGQYMSNNWK